MLEMLKARKEQLQAEGKKGFTLMEMLIVIAIIAILIAIAIPIFTGQMDRANAATDLANIRSGYAQVQSDIMLNNVKNTTYVLQKDATVVRSTDTSTSTSTPYTTKGKAENAGDGLEVGGLSVGSGNNAAVTWGAGQQITYTVDENGKITKIAGGASDGASGGSDSGETGGGSGNGEGGGN